jgi:hypothetical protein
MSETNWSERGTGEVVLDDGRVVKIRRIDGLELAESLQQLPTLAAEESAPLTIEQRVAYTRFFMERGTVEPRVYCGDFFATPADRVHVSAFEADERERIVAGIVALSRLGVSAATVRPFPAGGGGGDAASSGDVVRHESDNLPTSPAV